MIIVTRLNQIEEAGMFTLAFSTACIIYIIGTYAGRIFQVTESNKDITDKDFLFNRFLTCILMMIATVVFVFVRGYEEYKILIFILIALYKCIEAFSDCIYGIFQKNDKLYKVGQSYFIKSLLSLISFYVIDKLTSDLILSITSIIVVWIVVTLVYDVLGVRKLIKKEDKVNFKNVFSIFKSGFLVFIITFLNLYILNAPKYAIDSYSTEYFQTIFGIIVMPATAISLFGQFLLHPYLNKFVESIKNKRIDILRKDVRKIVLIIFAFGILASLGAYLVGVLLLQLVYNVDLSAFRIELVSIIVAATLYNIGYIYTSVLITFRKNVIQLFLYIALTIFACVASNILTINYGIVGATIAYSATMALYFVLYFITNTVFIKKEEARIEG
jgi:O-antigen/teichoic acid export membrane protein